MVFYAVLAGKLWSAFGFIMAKANSVGEPALLFGVFLFIAPFMYLIRSVLIKHVSNVIPMKKTNEPVELPQSLSDWISRALLHRLCESLSIDVVNVHTRIIVDRTKWIFSIYMAKLRTGEEDMVMLTAEFECIVAVNGTELEITSTKSHFRFTSESTKIEKTLKAYLSQFRTTISCIPDSSLPNPDRKLFLHFQKSSVTGYVGSVHLALQNGKQQIRLDMPLEELRRSNWQQVFVFNQFVVEGGVTFTMQIDQHPPLTRVEPVQNDELCLLFEEGGCSVSFSLQMYSAIGQAEINKAESYLMTLSAN